MGDRPKAPTATPKAPPDAGPADAAITSRRSIRAYLPTPVPQATVRAILQVASRAPSGTNTQPWHVFVVSGDQKAKLTETVLAAREAGEEDADYPYYPDKWWDPYLARRRNARLGLDDLPGKKKGLNARVVAVCWRSRGFL